MVFENKNASSRIRSARLDYSLLSSGLSWSVLVGDLDFSCGRTDEGTLRGPCGPKNGKKTTSFFIPPPSGPVQTRWDESGLCIVYLLLCIF